jgi:hypothetical protein
VYYNEHIFKGLFVFGRTELAEMSKKKGTRLHQAGMPSKPKKLQCFVPKLLIDLFLNALVFWTPKIWWDVSFSVHVTHLRDSLDMLPAQQPAWPPL